jgi:hypothetical protein
MCTRLGGPSNPPFSLVYTIQKMLHGLVILEAFLDTEGAFDYTIFESMCKAAKNMG